MSEDKKTITSGILSGFEIDEERAKIVGDLADEYEVLHNGKINPEERTLAKLFGAEDRPKDAASAEEIVDADAGSQVAEQGLLTGAKIDAEIAEEVKEVAETIEELENEDGKLNKDPELGEIEDTIAVVMGVETET